MGSQIVQFIGGHVQQRSHLIDERAGAAGAAAVHADFQILAAVVGEEQDFGVLAAQLNDRVHVAQDAFHGLTGGVDLLLEGQAQPFGQTHTGGAGNGKAHVAGADGGGDVPEHGGGLLRDHGIVSFVLFIQERAGVIQGHGLEGGGADIQTDANFFIQCKSPHKTAKRQYKLRITPYFCNVKEFSTSH